MMKRLTSLAGAVLLAVASQAASAEVATYTIEPTHTFVYFEVMHYKTATVRGRFDRKAGIVTVDPAARSGTADISVETGSINSGIAAFDGMLRSDKFFDSEKHPVAQFTASGFTFSPSGQVEELQGRLTLRGVTHPVTLRASHFNCYQHPNLKREICGGDFRASLNRRQWGMTSFDVIPDDVGLLIQVEAIRQ